MNLEKCRETYYEFSGKLSDNSRKLAFAGIAIVWIFKQEKNDAYIIPSILKAAMLMFVISLSLDLAQYIYQTIVWKRFHDSKEKELSCDEEAEFLAPTRFKEIADKIFWAKISTLAIGYIIVLVFFL
jgi:hypothetical protein